jgi:hypothetical protein
MRNFFSVAPGALWIAIIMGLTAGAALLSDYFGASVPAWVPALILTVIVPMLKVFAQGEPPAVRGEVTVYRSRASRWLW